MRESQYIHKSHNVSVLLYHFVCPAKYRRVVLSKAVDETLKNICLEIEKRYEVYFLEIGTDNNHVHFLLQSVPTKSPTQIIKMLKSVTAREVFRLHPEVKKQLWGGEFWTDGYYIATVSGKGSKKVIEKYIENQGKEEYNLKQLTLFEL